MSKAIVGGRAPSRNHHRLIYWKEARLLLPLWLTLLAVFLVVTAVAAAAFSPGPTDAFFRINIVSCCAFALVAGICMFVYERENKTDQFLSSLPVSSSVVFRTKFLSGFIATLLFLSVACAITWLTVSQIKNGVLSRGARIEYVTSCFLLPLECFLISVLMSLVFKRILVAIVATAGSVVVFVMASYSLVTTSPNGLSNELTSTAAVVAVRLAGLAVVGGAVLLAGRTWLRGRGIKSREIVPPNKTEATSALASNTNSVSWIQNYSSLFWQSIRQQATPFLAIGTIILLVTSSRVVESSEILISAILGLFFLLGICTFSSDQFQNRFRFFQHYGVRPRRLWLARVISMLIFVTQLVAVLCLYLAYSDHFSWRFSQFDTVSVSVQALLAAFLGVSIGQFFSMHVRSIVLAILLGAIVCSATFYWLDTTQRLKAEPLITTIPLIIGFLFSTWVKSKSWIAELRPVRSNLISATILFVAFALTVVGIGYERWHNVESAQSISIDLIKQRHQQLISGQPLTGVYQSDAGQDAVDAARLYIRALAVFKPRGEMSDEEFVSANSKALKLIHKTTKRMSCYPFLDPDSKANRDRSRKNLIELLTAAAKIDTQNGELDRALKSHLAVLQVSKQQAIENLKIDIQPILDWSIEPGQIIVQVSTFRQTTKTTRGRLIFDCSRQSPNNQTTD